MGSDTNDYEADRAKRIARNQEMLSQLGVRSMASKIIKTQRDEEDRRRRRIVGSPNKKGPVRRSVRRSAAETRARIRKQADSGTETGSSPATSDEDEEDGEQRRINRMAGDDQQGEEEADYDPLKDDIREERSSIDGSSDSNGARVDEGISRRRPGRRKKEKDSYSEEEKQALQEAIRRSLEDTDDVASADAGNPKTAGNAVGFTGGMDTEGKHCSAIIDGGRTRRVPKKLVRPKPRAGKDSRGREQGGYDSGSAGKPPRIRVGRGKKQRKGIEWPEPTAPEVLEAFGMFDKNGSGLVTPESIAVMAADLTIPIGDEVLQSMMDYAKEITDCSEIGLTTGDFQLLVAHLGSQLNGL